MKVCLITPGHFSSTPRLIREALALEQAGHQVHVIAGKYHQPSADLDQNIINQAKWEFTTFSLTSLERASLKLLSWTNQTAMRLGLELGLAARFLTHYPLGAVLLSKIRDAAPDADLYLGHTLPALYAAVHAAEELGGQAGIDIEDYQPAENINHAEKNAVTWETMKTWLPCCQHLTAAAPLIAQKCEQEFGVTSKVVLNTYPIEEAPAEPVSPGIEIQFYWFSQTIGPGRGLEKMIRIMGSMTVKSRLVLRGMINESYRQDLIKLAREAGIEPLEILKPCSPDTIVSNCAGYHFGLSVEETEPENRDLCLTNKLFAYLLAGTPVILSSTQAHRKISRELGAAAIVLDFERGEYENAAMLDTSLSSSKDMLKARETAWQLGRERYHWEIDADTVVQQIQHSQKKEQLAQ